MTVERLQKILSRAGVASRRASERLMLDGRVVVNGATVRELGTKADAARDDIRVDGRRIKAEPQRYFLLNKPRGYVTTRADPQRRPTVIDLLAGVREHVYPVGRLDFESEGLLILTNDGALAATLTHPSHEVPRVYEARVLGIPDAHELERLRRGVIVDGRKTAPAEIHLHADARTSTPRRRPRSDGRRAEPSTATLTITLREGRNRQVRKMCEAIGHPVERLRRVAIGPIRDAGLKPGQWRELTAAELKKLQRACPSSDRPNADSSA